MNYSAETDLITFIFSATNLFTHTYYLSRAYFLLAPGGIGKSVKIQALRTLVEIRGQKVRTVATSPVLATILD